MADAGVVFKLNDVDYSANVVAEGYQVNLKDIYQEWTDGGQVKHRDVVGKKIQGKFQMYFNTEANLQTFLTALATAKTSSNTYPVKVKANNDTIDSLTASKNVFLDFEPVRKRNAAWADVYEVFEVTIEEA